MQWLRKIAGGVNDHYDVATEVQLAVTPSIRRVRKLEARGTTANGVITGIRFSVRGETTRKEFAIAVQQADGWRRYGVRTQPPEAHRLRLGVPVVVKVDGDRAILDWEAMREAWGLQGQALLQESMRTPPADGIVDTAVTSRQHRNLTKGARIDATIRSLDRCTMLGMATLNWDIDLTTADGRTFHSKSDEVPSYAQWYAAPGAVVPIAIDPRDPSRATIDWARFALDRAGDEGFDDDPPPGSIATEVEASRGAGATSAVSTPGDPATPSTQMIGPSAAVLDMTLRSWIDAYRGGHMKRKAFEKALDDWVAGGMCAPDQAAAARAAAYE